MGSETVEALSAYHLYGNFVQNFPSNGTGIFFRTKNRNGIELYHLQNNPYIHFSLFLERKGDTTGNPNKWYRKFRSFR